jgi:hypothetical protein
MTLRLRRELLVAVAVLVTKSRRPMNEWERNPLP